jgi:hypothetical protein
MLFIHSGIRTQRRDLSSLVTPPSPSHRINCEKLSRPSSKFNGNADKSAVNASVSRLARCLCCLSPLLVLFAPPVALEEAFVIADAASDSTPASNLNVYPSSAEPVDVADAVESVCCWRKPGRGGSSEDKEVLLLCPEPDEEEVDETRDVSVALAGVVELACVGAEDLDGGWRYCWDVAAVWCWFTRTC